MIGQRSGRDWTARMNSFAAKRVKALTALEIAGYVFKKNSPSCGGERVKVYNLSGIGVPQGRGLFAAILMRELPLLPVEEEGGLKDPARRENFVERVFAYHRWHRLARQRKSARLLIDFHTRHKLLLLAHSERHHRRLGRIVAGAKRSIIGRVYTEYGRLFMEGLSVHATVRRHCNVLEHMLGYFSDRLSPAERQELLSVVNDFRRRLVPLIAPLTLVSHYVAKYRVQYLQDQVYLQPSPKELMLRNHV
jgi:uncharacterized protein YbgA (DUF1722 family)